MSQGELVAVSGIQEYSGNSLDEVQRRAGGGRVRWRVSAFLPLAHHCSTPSCSTQSEGDSLLGMSLQHPTLPLPGRGTTLASCADLGAQAAPCPSAFPGA